MGRNRNKTSKTPIEPSVSQQKSCYEGERLFAMLKSLQREIELAKLSNRVLPEKIWFKQQFSIGVNEVTRVLERMTPCSEMGGASAQQPLSNPNKLQIPSVGLQAILVASDSNPRWLTKHLPSLASSRKVPLIFVKDKKGGSLRLGELVKLKTAMAIGIKARGNGINQVVEEILHGKEGFVNVVAQKMVVAELQNSMFDNQPLEQRRAGIMNKGIETHTNDLLIMLTRIFYRSRWASTPLSHVHLSYKNVFKRLHIVQIYFFMPETTSEKAQGKLLLAFVLYVCQIAMLDIHCLVQGFTSNLAWDSFFNNPPLFN